MVASVWRPGQVDDIETINADNSRKSERFVAIAGQTVFNLTNFAYAVGTGSLQVNINGIQQYPGTDFVETNSGVFTMNAPMEAGDLIDAYGLVGSPAAQSASVAAASAADSAAMAQSSVEAVNASADAAAASANLSAQNANAADGYKLGAQGFRNEAEGFKNNAANSAAAAYQSELNAAASAQNASTAATTAAQDAQVQADWAVSDTSRKDYIKNKTSVLQMLLTGFATGANAYLAVTDTIIGAFGKIQGRMNYIDGWISTLNDEKAAKATTIAGYGIVDGVVGGSVNTYNGTTLKAPSGYTPMYNIHASGNTEYVPLCVLDYGHNDAATVIRFVRNNRYGAFFGLDNDNKWKVGGESMGTVAHELWHKGNFDPELKSGVLGAVAVAGSGTQRGLFKGMDSAGNPRFQWGIDTNNESVLWTYDSSGGYTGNIHYYSGGFAAGGGISALTVTQTSDDSKKKNREAYPDNILDKFAAFTKVGKFTWIEDDKLSLGGSAQEFQTILPEAIHVSKIEKTLTVNYSGANTVLLHKLANRLIALEAEVAQLKQGK